MVEGMWYPCYGIVLFCIYIYIYIYIMEYEYKLRMFLSYWGRQGFASVCPPFF